MLGVRGPPGIGGLDMLCEPLEVGIDALVEELADEAQKHGITQRRSNRRVELPIERHPIGKAQVLPLGLLEHHVQSRHILAARSARGLLCHGTLDESTRADNLEGSLVGHAGGLGGGDVLDDIDPGANADPQPALDLKRNQRLTHGGTRHGQSVSELAFAGQATADGEFAAINQMPQLIGDLPVEPARFDGLNGQSALPEWDTWMRFLGRRL